jgi:LysM repeat protein
VYVSEYLITRSIEYLVTDGKQSLAMTTDRFFTYTADMSKAVYFLENNDHLNAEATITDFLQAHGFSFPHTVAKGDLFGGYMVEPLSPDGLPMRYEFFSSRPMRVLLDENGQVLQIEANLMEYEPVSAQTYDIISAEEAFQRLMDDTLTAGKIESALHGSFETKQWIREYPNNETITIYGYASSVPALDSAQPAFIQIDGFTVTGNSSGMEALERNTFVEATGRFIVENGIEKFKVESWQISGPIQEGLIGTLTSENGQVIFKTEQGDRLVIQPEIPADIPLPFENAFVVGARRDDTYHWTLIDNRMSLGGGGGGGGGGLGFYKLNLSGTPVPFPPAAPTPGAEDGRYIVQAGDTLTSIANAFGITMDELLQANSLTIDSLIFIDQQLIIPGGDGRFQDPIAGRRLENQRGIVTVSIYQQPDGSLREEYVFATTMEGQNHYLPLTGEDLQELKKINNRPVNIWGIVEATGSSPVLSVSVERYEIPFPDLQFQILRGTQRIGNIDGRSALLFTTEDGITYIQITPGNDPALFLLGNEGDPVILEVLSVPDETIGGYPTLHVFGAAMATSPKNGEPVELTVTADQIYTVDETVESQVDYIPPALIIEKVELMYFVTNPHWQVDRLDGGPLYIQPVWRFYGHYESGGEFEVIVQALKEQYLLPELDTYVQGG